MPPNMTSVITKRKSSSIQIDNSNSKVKRIPHPYFVVPQIAVVKGAIVSDFFFCFLRDPKRFVYCDVCMRRLVYGGLRTQFFAHCDKWACLTCGYVGKRCVNLGLTGSKIESTQHYYSYLPSLLRHNHVR
jgi:hypothetical protein